MYINLRKSFAHRLLCLTTIVTLGFSNFSYARSGGGLSILRDAEIEHTIRMMSEPIFDAAELDKNAVSTYLINDDSLNAFVAGGQNIFLHSGLLITAKDANQVIGVIAHETGHITGGHLSRFSDGVKSATVMSLIGAVLGAAAIAAGAGDAGMALILGGQQVGTRTFLKYSRTQESAADQAGLTFLEKSGQSGVGLIDFLDYLGDQELMSSRYRDPYAGTHPVSSERISKLRDRVETSPYFKKPTPAAIEHEFKRLQAKLYGYLKPPYATLNKYPLKDQSLYGKYARAFAYHQKHEPAKALKELEDLLGEYPNDPFFWETKGQILYENGKVRESILPYQNAVKNLPDESLIRVSLAQSLIATEDDQFLKEAVQHLEYAISRDRQNAFAWHQMSVAQHRLNHEAMTYYATAERFLLIGNLRGAMINARHAVDSLPKNTPNWYRAQDILVVTESNMSDKQRKKNDTEQREENRKSDKKLESTS
ncbi:peptidase [Paremcibacter congregatus]|uniref:Peptidase n=1 Tax=Paremcibacter congregatus TaxID=2043170 RepID=A0A2G4YQP6_9PROT|nr:peptidase [Paremcibacter congregatus]QDE27479.1 M48 family peptidase [Paremcibacter congregatus]